MCLFDHTNTDSILSTSHSSGLVTMMFRIHGPNGKQALSVSYMNSSHTASIPSFGIEKGTTI